MKENTMSNVKNAIAGATILLLGATAANAVVPADSRETTNQTRCLIQGDGLNIRDKPSLYGNKVAALEPSDTVTLGRVINGDDGRRWAFVTTQMGEGDSDTYEGWVSYKYLTCQGDKPHEGAPHRRRVRYYTVPRVFGFPFPFRF
jgi:hypothetical protein